MITPQQICRFLDANWPGWQYGRNPEGIDYILVTSENDSPLMVELDKERKPGFLDVNGERCYSAAWL